MPRWPNGKKLISKICLCCQKKFDARSWEEKRQFCSLICRAHYLADCKRLSKGDFTILANKKYDSFFDYSNLPLKFNKKQKIEIICPEHGKFIQEAGKHLRCKGAACRECNDKKQRKTTEQFIKEAREIHGNKYDYSLTEYTGFMRHLIIICPEHGIFNQTPSQHLIHQAGCSNCKNIIRISKNEREWLDFYNVPNDKDHRQVYIGKNSDHGKYYIVDGLSKDKTIIYEYLGDYWHGNPKIFKANEYNASCKKSFGDLLKETKERLENLKKLGYNVIHIWESDWLERKLNV